MPARLGLRVAIVGPAMYPAAVAGLGVLLLSGKIVNVWAPLPLWVPGRNALTCAYGALLLVLAVALLWQKTVTPSSAALALLFLSWLLFVQVPRIAGTPSKEILWAGGAQIASVVAGAWLLFAARASPTEGAARRLAGPRAAQMARAMYAVALPFFGLHHFVDLAGAAEAVPAWLPFRMGWAFLTGTGHVAVGAAILLRIVPRLAAMLEAIMITSFVLLVHVPGVVSAPADRLQWTMLVVASAIAGAAWIVAGSYADGAYALSDRAARP